MTENYPLTVTHVLGVNQESIYPAVKVKVDGRMLYAWLSDVSCIEITGGSAYVVNQGGKTVAKYRLEG